MHFGHRGGSARNFCSRDHFCPFYSSQKNCHSLAILDSREIANLGVSNNSTIFRGAGKTAAAAATAEIRAIFGALKAGTKRTSVDHQCLTEDWCG